MAYNIRGVSPDKVGGCAYQKHSNNIEQLRLLSDEQKGQYFCFCVFAYPTAV